MFLRQTTSEAARRSTPAGIPSEVLSRAGEIIADVRKNGLESLRSYSRTFDGLSERSAELLSPEQLADALHALPPEMVATLQRTADRIRAFAQAQRSSITDLDVAVPGGRAGHTVLPIERAGCYAPGGRHPLISSALMTVIAAREAGVKSVWLATPSADPLMLAAASIAGADGVLLAGGAHAIAALAYGVEGVPASDVIVGPGNLWVTAAKQIVSRDVGIDMLAGPSEVLVIADGIAKPALIAADLLAQAEHDTEAIVTLVLMEKDLLPEIESQLALQLATLSTHETATVSLQQGRVILATDESDAAAIANRLAPEHLELHVANPAEFAKRIEHCGGLFIGEGSAEVFGDYGTGPNHVLPTAGTARRSGGLSVFTFLRVRTWMNLDADRDIAMNGFIDDVVALARMEGLAGHARAAELRK